MKSSSQWLKVAFLSFGLMGVASVSEWSFASDASCTPASPGFQQDLFENPKLLFCKKWNPDFEFNSNQCCGSPPPRGIKRRLARCPKNRSTGFYCHERSPEQLDYEQKVRSGEIADVLEHLTLEMGRSSDQAFCGVNNGFLVSGKMVIETKENRLFSKSQSRCLHFGTNGMIAMLEWLGREVASEYSQKAYDDLRLVIGDISAPRGGCLIGRYGRRGHLSHTSGQDVDIGFLWPRAKGMSPRYFHRRFYPDHNWWLLKKLFSNPYTCIKVVFLDRNHIEKLRKHAAKDPEWQKLKRFIRHAPFHQNHMHVRIGTQSEFLGYSGPGCTPSARPELELADDESPDTFEEIVEASILDELKSRQSPSI